MGMMLRIGVWCAIAACVVASTTASAQSVASTTASAQSVAPVRYRLRNGLDVVLEERHTTPQVAVQVRYHVGTRDQPEGHTGLAHMTEHLMFSWARSARRGALEFLDGVGAVASNGITSPDATDYFEVIHRSALERVLAFESDRMGFLLDHVDQGALDQQRRVVLRENRDREEWWDVPGLGRLVQELLYGQAHPYRLNAEVPAHVSAITLDHVRWFHQHWYVPSNATLVVVGDFETAAVRGWIDRYFGGLARVERPTRVELGAQPPPRERTITAYSRAIEGRVLLMYPTPALYAPGDAEMDLVSDMLTGHAYALLNETVVGQGLARAISSGQSSMQLGSRFTIVADAANGVDGARVLDAIDRQLEWVKSRPISQAELDGLRATRMLAMRRSEDSILARAGTLALYASYHQGDPDWLERDLDRYRRVTPGSLQRALRAWLDRDRRDELSTRGAGAGRRGRQRGDGSAPVSVARVRRAVMGAFMGAIGACAAAGDGFPPPRYPLSRSVEEPFRARVPPVGPIASWTPPAVEQWTLPNGLRVLFSPRAGCDLVSMSVVAYRAGSADAIAESGNANTLIEMLPSGTRAHPSATHAAALRAIGASIHSSIDPYAISLAVTVSRDHRDAALALLAESALEPELSELEFRRVIRAQAEQRRRSVRSPTGVAYRSITRMLFGTQSAFAASWTSSIESIATRSHAAVTRFHSERFVPSRVAVVVTGDATRAEVEAMIQRSFGAWNAPAPPIPDRARQTQFPAMPVPWRVYENSGSAQAMVFLGFRLPGRASPEFAAASQAHRVFAESFGSRLSSSIRETLGLAYSVDGAIESTEDTALSLVTMTIDGASAQQVLRRVLDELRRMHARPVRVAELRAAQASNRNAILGQFDGIEGVRSLIEALPGREADPSCWTTALESVSGVTREAVLEATHRYFDERSMAVVIVGDRGQLAPQVLAVSPVSALLEDEAP